MPPKRSTPTPRLEVEHRIGSGAGMTAGLEIWSATVGGKRQFVLVDKTIDSRFATDTATWNIAAGLNEASTKILKDATQ
jgi:hypothetical protein